MDVPYLLHVPDGDELWLVDGEQRLLITPRIYDLLASNGADLPPAYGIEELREQNAKLRELCKRFAEYVSQDRCEGCVYKRRCDGGEIDECWQLTEIREIARELGIEVE